MQPDVITFSILIKANCDVGRHFTLHVCPWWCRGTSGSFRFTLILIANDLFSRCELYHEGLSAGLKKPWRCCLPWKRLVSSLTRRKPTAKPKEDKEMNEARYRYSQESGLTDCGCCCAWGKVVFNNLLGGCINDCKLELAKDFCTM